MTGSAPSPGPAPGPTPSLVALGEAMAVVATTEPGPFAHGAPMGRGWAGAGATVAVGVSRLGHTAAWTGRVGDDAAGAMVLAGLRAEGVDVSGARTDPDARAVERAAATGHRRRNPAWRRGDGSLAEW
ncbi:PfkB family carbohydrate kinase [Streptomyces sp. NE5-10]|uniref:PfkB family carbohydrate kinase n=1 Tax=Streptomyces sp. NE5-10 TaxID=2759674 RepID=UPI00241377B5|nr:PfkB family carbohydrate kinase [Streptomyces sp. NE5-10]